MEQDADDCTPINQSEPRINNDDQEDSVSNNENEKDENLF